MKTVTVFGSSLPREGSAAYAEARRLGELLAKRGFALANGGYAGLMEATARGAREAGGHTLGVTCAIWPAAANPWIVEEIRTQSFFGRLTTLIERGDAYIVLPGGTGTLAELALVWEMMNKSALSQSLGGRKPLVVMVPYWQAVIDCLSQEASLAEPPALRRAPAMDFVTTVSNAEQAVEILLEKL
jgi:uncharacterized protein (TIGR00730 family)